jgi:hypothetical protein
MKQQCYFLQSRKSLNRFLEMKARKTSTTMKTTAARITDYCGSFIYSDNQLITIFAGDVRVAPVNVGNRHQKTFAYNRFLVFSSHILGLRSVLITVNTSTVLLSSLM